MNLRKLIFLSEKTKQITEMTSKRNSAIYTTTMLKKE